MGQLCNGGQNSYRPPTRGNTLHVRVKMWRGKESSAFDFKGKAEDYLSQVFLARRSGFLLLERKSSELLFLRAIGNGPKLTNFYQIRLDLENLSLEERLAGPGASPSLFHAVSSSEKVAIKPGEELRMGRGRIRFVELHRKEKSNNFLEIISASKSSAPRIRNEENREVPKKVGVVSASEGLECRVCLEKGTESNPFPELCSCAAHNPYHADCMSSWMARRTQVEKGNGIFIFNKEACSCDLCGENFPLFFEVGGKVFSLFQFEPDRSKDFVHFEVLDPETSQTRRHILIYLSTSKVQINIGRSLDNGIVLDSEGVEKRHACLCITDETVRVSDLGSQFGTLKSFSFLSFKDHPKARIVIDRFCFSLSVYRSQGDCNCQVNNQPNARHVLLDPLDTHELSQIFPVVEVRKRVENDREIPLLSEHLGLRPRTQSLTQIRSFHREGAIDSNHPADQLAEDQVSTYGLPIVQKPFIADHPLPKNHREFYEVSPSIGQNNPNSATPHPTPNGEIGRKLSQLQAIIRLRESQPLLLTKIKNFPIFDADQSCLRRSQLDAFRSQQHRPFSRTEADYL